MSTKKKQTSSASKQGGQQTPCPVLLRRTHELLNVEGEIKHNQAIIESTARACSAARDAAHALYEALHRKIRDELDVMLQQAISTERKASRECEKAINALRNERDAIKNDLGHRLFKQ